MYKFVLKFKLLLSISNTLIMLKMSTPKFKKTLQNITNNNKKGNYLKLINWDVPILAPKPKWIKSINLPDKKDTSKYRPGWVSRTPPKSAVKSDPYSNKHMEFYILGTPQTSNDADYDYNAYDINYDTDLYGSGLLDDKGYEITGFRPTHAMGAQVLYNKDNPKDFPTYVFSNTVLHGKGNPNNSTNHNLLKGYAHIQNDTVRLDPKEYTSNPTLNLLKAYSKIIDNVPILLGDDVLVYKTNVAHPQKIRDFYKKGEIGYYRSPQNENLPEYRAVSSAFFGLGSKPMNLNQSVKGNGMYYDKNKPYFFYSYDKNSPNSPGIDRSKVSINQYLPANNCYTSTCKAAQLGLPDNVPFYLNLNTFPTTGLEEAAKDSRNKKAIQRIGHFNVWKTVANDSLVNDPRDPKQDVYNFFQGTQSVISGLSDSDEYKTVVNTFIGSLKRAGKDLKKLTEKVF